MKLFDQIIEKIKKRKSLDLDVEEFKKKHQKKLEYLIEVHKHLKSKPEGIKDDIKKFVDKEHYGDFYEGISDPIQYVEYLQELNSMGLIKFSDDNFETLSSEIVNELNEKKKESELGKVEKKHLESILDDCESKFIDMREWDYDFIDKSSFLKYLDKMMSITGNLRQKISEVDDDFVSGPVLEMFHKEIKRVESLQYAVHMFFCIIEKEIKTKGPDLDKAVDLIRDHVFKMTDGVKDKENLEQIKDIILKLESVKVSFECAGYELKYFAKELDVNIDEIVEKVENFIKKVEIENSDIKIDFNISKMFEMIAFELANNEEINKILETDKADSDKTLMSVVNIVFEAIEKYMKQTNMNFIFDVDCIIDNKNYNNGDIISFGDMNQKRGAFAAKLNVYKQSIEYLNKNESSGVKKFFHILEIVFHESAHRLDYLRGRNKDERVDVFSELKKKGFLDYGSYIDKYDVKLLMNLSPSLVKKVHELKKLAKEQAEKSGTKNEEQIFNSLFDRFAVELSFSGYFKNDIEVFARHFAAESIVNIVRGLKYYYAKEKALILAGKKEGDIGESEAKINAKLDNLKIFDTSEIQLIDNQNNGYYIEFKEGDNSEIYLLAHDKISEDDEGEIEEMIKLALTMSDDVKRSCSCSSILNLKGMVIDIDDEDLRWKIESKSRKILSAYIKNLSDLELYKLVKQAIKLKCEPVIAAIMEMSSEFRILSIMDEKYHEYLQSCNDSKYLSDENIKKWMTKMEELGNKRKKEDASNNLNGNVNTNPID